MRASCVKEALWSDWFSDPKRAKSALTATLQRKLEEKNPWSDALMDGLNLHHVRQLRKNRVLVSFLFERAGNSTLQFAKKLTDAGFTLLYDADSAEAEAVLHNIPATQRLGISANTPQSPEILHIENPFIRMRAFEAAHTVIITPRSLTAAGVLLDEGAHFVFDPKNVWRELKSPEYVEGKKQLRIGYKLTKIDGVPKSMKTLPPEKFPQTLPEFNPAVIQGLENIELVELLEYADQYVAMQNQLRSLAKKHATFFGWSRNHEEFRKANYDVIRRTGELGFAIRTGGSRGYMEVANQAALDAGAISIGIPMMGMGRLGTEQEVPAHLHTATLATRSYEVRIGGLLWGTDAVFIGAGSGGTVQEIAATLVKMGGDMNPSPLLFISSAYYGKLFHWLYKVFATEFTHSYFKLIDGPSEVGMISGGN